jgi:hypothetical protein
MLCNDVSFLTKKASAGDKVLYIGGSVGAYILLLARMFPSVNFALYDHNMSNSVKKAKEEGFMPANLNHSPEVFSEQVAAKLLLVGKGCESQNLLLMSDLRNITRNAWGQQGHAAVTDDNVINDLHLQVQVLLLLCRALIQSHIFQCRRIGCSSSAPSHRRSSLSFPTTAPPPTAT